MMLPEFLPGTPGRLLLIADHASNAVPGEVSLGVAAGDLQKHVAWDIGTADMTRALAERLGAPAVLATASRLVADCNRDPEDEGVLPPVSDGVTVPGNAGLSGEARAERLRRWHAPYHAALTETIETVRPRLLVSLHSFTPRLATRDEVRPWEAALLHNRDDRAARIAIAALRAEGLTVGDNEPYSGAVYGYTTDRHAEARGLPYLTFEIRQDLLGDDSAIAAWTERLARVIGVVESELLETIS